MRRKISKFYSSLKFSLYVTYCASRKYFFIRMFLQVVSGLIPLIIAYIFKETIDILASQLVKVAVIHIPTTFYILVFSLFFIKIASDVLYKFNEFISGLHQECLTKHIELEIAKKAASLDLSYYDSTKFYDELKGVQRDSFALQILTNNIFLLMRTIVQLVGVTIVLFSFNYIIAIGMYVLFIPSAILYKKYTQKLYQWTRSKTNVKRKMAYTLDTLLNKNTAQDTRLYQYKNLILSKYKSFWEECFNEKKSILRNKFLQTSLSSSLPFLGVAVVSLIVGLRVFEQQLSLGDFTLYCTITTQLSASIFSLISVISNLYESNMKISYFQTFLKWENKLIAEGSRKINTISCIKFMNVSFKYPGKDQFALKNVTFTLEQNEKVAFVGRNGAGKTTILKLLLRFYDPVSGDILINGVNIKEYNLHEYRKKFSVMFQNYFNYSFTVKDSIILSDINQEMNSNKLKYALHQSGVDKILSKHKKTQDSYMTRKFSLDGLELSGGEWQKLALARVFYRDSCVQILDEPSSSLDPESEKELFENMVKAFEHKITILISHRLSNVKLADKIIVIDDGEVVESGAHNELIKYNGVYSYLYNLQAEKYSNN